jgi:predicted nuclease with TOPRIM domain
MMPPISSSEPLETDPQRIKTLLTTTLPSYITKLERKQLAAERSAGAKAKRIEELKGENSLLRNKIRVLEETVSALKTRRPLS